MAWLVVLSLLAGITLAQRFNVFGLIPMLVFALVAMVGIGTVRADAAWDIAMSVIAVTCALEIGYLIGAILRSARTRLAEQHALHMNKSLRPTFRTSSPNLG